MVSLLNAGPPSSDLLFDASCSQVSLAWIPGGSQDTLALPIIGGSSMETLFPEWVLTELSLLHAPGTKL